MAQRAKPAAGGDFKEILWKAADKLRGSMDSAEYKHFVLGLVFLKYVSDAFAERRAQAEKELTDEGIPAERIPRMLEDRDEFTGSGVFWVPPRARWETLAANAKSRSGASSVGELIDGAMDAIEKDNPDLRGVLPKIFNRSNVDERRLAELVDLIGRIGFGGQFDGNGDRRSPRDVLGEVYEYFLGMFSLAEGRRGGEYFTPASVVKLLVEILAPKPGSRVYDPCCGSGGMFIQSEKFIESHGGNPFDIAVYGQELNQNTWRMAKMNLAIHGISADLGPRWGDTFHDDKHPDLRADVVLANPPFNISDWGGDQLAMDPRWSYGVPPARNANYAWLQHMASKMSRRGMAGIVLANGSMSSNQSGEGAIRRAMVEDDLVACMVALPPQLFRTSQIPACLWFLAADKSPQGAKQLADRRGQVLFIDASKLGVMTSRILREFLAEEIQHIVDTYRIWRGIDRSREYADVTGFCSSANLKEVRQQHFVLSPSRYVGASGAVDDVESIKEKIEGLVEVLLEQVDESARWEQAVIEQLRRIDV